MERFYGFDLGDAESAVSRLQKKEQSVPEVIPVCGAKSFITAYANLSSGELQIGEQACYSANAIRRRIRFKSSFLTDPSVAEDVKRFAAGVLGELYGSGDLVQNDDCCFYIGCPAGWSKNARERYREIFERAGYPPARIVSESRAALVSACQSRHLQVGYDILAKPVLVVDIGSSTTDFAYIMGGKEVEMRTGGEVLLGGGLMDEILLENSIASSPDGPKLRKVFEESEPWRSYCEFAARRLKEKYFSDEEFFKDSGCTETIMVRYGKPLKLTLRADAQAADRMLRQKIAKLGGRSFEEVFLESLREIRENIGGQMPELLFLTGGVSRLGRIRTWCEEVFPEAVIISGAEPEFSVSRGLAWSGRIDDELRDFRRELEQLKESRTIEDIVKKHIDGLYKGVVDALVEPIIEQVAVPIFDRWRDGSIERLADVDGIMEKDIEAFLRTDEAKRLLAKPVKDWLKLVSDELEEYTVPICVNHHVPYSALSLNSFLSASDLDIKIEARNVFAVEEMTFLIDSIISLLVGLICGASGMALLSTGPGGIVAGVMISIVVLFLGKSKMEEAVLAARIPKSLRKIVPKNTFRNRMEGLTASIKSSFHENLEKEKNEEITAKLVDDIATQIEECLTKMAEVVEIPLG